MTERFYVTTPIYYINDVPHLGSAYTTIAADVLCRYQGLRGKDAYFLTGTDEHGLKIQQAADARGISAQELADQTSQRFREAWPELSCAPSDFIRTSSARHQEGARELWRRIEAAGDIYLGHYEGLYCVGCEGYYTEKELKQPGNLCPLHNRSAELVKEESYFFRLSKYGDRLLKFWERNPDAVMPAGRMNEVKRFVEGGLQDLCVSRTTFDWGIPVPGNDKHVMWVWIDALSNYWTALQQDEHAKGYWPATVHVLGKDILRFHAVFWPAFLMSAGFGDDELPQKTIAHGFLTYGGQKMSKSLRNTIGPVELSQALSPTVGADTLRYCLMRSVSFGHDGDFSIDDLLQRYASELGNTLGNLLNRVHPFASPSLSAANYGPLEEELRAAVQTAAVKAGEALDACAPTRALEAIWAGLAAANSYVDKAAPWVARKNNPERVETIVTTLVEVLEAFSVMVAPVMPTVAGMMREQLGLDALLPTKGQDLWPLNLPTRAPGTSICKGEPIFPRFDKAHVAALQERFAAPEAPTEPKPEKKAPPKAAEPQADKDEIGYEDFAKLQFVVGKVVAASKVKKKDRLLSLRVDVGEAEERAIIAGIAETYTPEQLLERKVVVLANLAPKKFGKGLLSHGMLLAATNAEGKPELVSVAEHLEPGSRVS